MAVDSVVSFSQQAVSASISSTMEVAAARRGLNQQKLEGQAALKLLEAAAIPVDPNLGQTINIKV